ncbi:MULTISPECIES: aminopeptidase [Myxococcus]|uniref:aminopeptidase n=1 Tax=Myxococcus TaxID=32 RepID=UPI0013D4E6F9|nr:MULTISPECIES: aminopeptidase [Myxococcus]NVJ20856.1 aminopeptidase [Myxococcus sp. AM011]
MSKVDERVWAGIDVLLGDYARLMPEDQVLVAYTPESRESAAWIATALRMRGMEACLLGMRPRPLKDETFAERLDAALPHPERLRGKLILITVERDSMSHMQIIRDALMRYDLDKWLVVRIINASQEFFIKALNVKSGTLSEINSGLLDRFMKARELRVKTPSGTDLRIGLDSDRYRWISNRGVWRPGSFLILPAGEVATFPSTVDGVLVADGAFNVNAMTPVDARLAKNPIRIRIKDGQAVDHECNSPEVSRLVEAVFAQPHSRRVGEVGFGTNGGLGDFIPMNSHLNERQPGVHLGFGQHNQSIHVMDYFSPIHMDLISPGGHVWVDDDPVPLDLLKLTPSQLPHPRLVFNEDIDGNCCGLTGEDELRELCPLPVREKAVPRTQQAG